VQQETHTIPIVFAQVLDPVGAGFVESLAHPGGNITGFVSFEYSMAGKWLETLKLMAPQLVRIGAVRDLASPSEMGMLGAIQALIPALAMEFVAVGGRDAADFERGIAHRDAERASRSRPSRVAHGGGLRERQQSAIAPITCGTPHREGVRQLFAGGYGRPIPSPNMPRPGQGDGRSCSAASL
jgi:hypothetical protein